VCVCVCVCVYVMLHIQFTLQLYSLLCNMTKELNFDSHVT